MQGAYMFRRHISQRSHHSCKLQWQRRSSKSYTLPRASHRPGINACRSNVPWVGDAA